MFFEAIDRIPMGIAVTLAFVGPLVMAAGRLAPAPRRRASPCWPPPASSPSAGSTGRRSVAGVVLALLTGCAWVAVAYAARSVGDRTRRLDGLALALPVAALLTLPLGVSHFDAIDGRTLAIALVIAVGGLILPFALELEGLRRLEPRVVAIVYSVDPGIARGDRLPPRSTSV